MKLVVEAWRRARDSDDCYKVTEAAFTFVAIGEDRRPRLIPSDDPALDY
jgi:acyl-CoA thioesterase YciA